MQAPGSKSRFDLELEAIKAWEETSEFRRHAQLLVDAIPRPPTDLDTIVALAAVSDIITLTGDAADPEKSEARGVAVAARAVHGMLTQLLEVAHMAGAPSAAKRCGPKRDDLEAYACLQQLQPFQPDSAPGEPDMTDAGEAVVTGGAHVLLHLTAVQHYAAKVVHRSVRDIPYVASSLTEDMMRDRHDHKPVFDAMARVPQVYAQLFEGQRGEYKTLWAEYVNVAGRSTHPPRFEAQLQVFDGELWQGSVISAREILSTGAPTPDHPLPDASALRFCFKSHDGGAHKGSKRPRSGSETFYLETDTLGALALLCGDLVYRFSLHLGDLIPELASGPKMAIPSKQLHQRVLTLGIWFQLCINYQTFLLHSTYAPFQVHELHLSLSYPVRDNPDCRKLVAFVYSHRELGPKRLAALPFLLTSRGLRDYHTFLADPDAYMAKVDCPASRFLNEITGIPSEARARVASRGPQRLASGNTSAPISFPGQARPTNQAAQSSPGFTFVSISSKNI